MIEVGLITLSRQCACLFVKMKAKTRPVLEAILNDLQEDGSFTAPPTTYSILFSLIMWFVLRSQLVLEVVLISFHQRDVKVRGKVKGALMYPAFVNASDDRLSTTVLTQKANSVLIRYC